MRQITFGLFLAGFFASFFLTAYFGAYLALLTGNSPWYDAPRPSTTEIRMRPEYRVQNPIVDAALYPANQLDRLVRAEYWTTLAGRGCCCCSDPDPNATGPVQWFDEVEGLRATDQLLEDAVARIDQTPDPVLAP
jgi:hypothetical protein